MSLKTFLRQVLDVPDRMACAKSRSTISPSASGVPVLSFGGILERRGPIHGGAVKLLHLRDAFAHDEACFNVLYLVSSAQPEFAADLVQLCKSRGIPFVWNQNGVGYPAWAGSEAERHNLPMQNLRAQADHVIYQSEFCRTSADKFLGPVSRSGEVLLNPVDLEKFHPATEPPAFRPLRLLALGTQNYPARVFCTIDCLKALRSGGVESVLTIAGRLLWKDGGAEVARHVEKLGLGEFVNLLPAFSQDEAAKLYRAHHILLHPKYLDPCPTVVIEALASGIPVVGSASGGLPEMVPPDCGKLISVPLDWNKLITPSGAHLAEAVQTLLPRQPEAARASRLHAERTFDGGRWVERHGEIFRNLPV
jgi:glycosyltransferase involved in cell wall biosynthesis